MDIWATIFGSSTKQSIRHSCISVSVPGENLSLSWDKKGSLLPTEMESSLLLSGVILNLLFTAQNSGGDFKIFRMFLDSN